MASFLAGDKRIAVAHAERNLCFGAEAVSTTARPNGREIRVAGCKRRVWDASEADFLLVSARHETGLAWCLVGTKQAGVTVQSNHADEAMPWAAVRLENAHGTVVCSDAAAEQALRRAILFAVAGVLAESIGCMATLVALTQDWLATRKQFGRTLWENQVLQHRCVDMFVALEESKSMLNLAAYAHDGMRMEDAQASMHAAKAHVANSARFVGQQAVHLHGAMGLTEEAFAGRAYRRLEALNAVFGGADHHTWAYALGAGSRIED
jgi:alkylation response protein AidB-like acyl-CoA dehydrogenase